MSNEVKPSFERSVPGEEALVIPDGMNNLKNEKLQEILDKSGVSLDLFQKLLEKEDLEWELVPHPIEFSPDGIKLEDIEFGVAKTELGLIEVSDVTFYPESINTDDISLHLKQVNHRGFEAMLIQEGSGSLFFPDRVDPVGTGIYGRSQEGLTVHVQKGDVVFIPAPTANGWTHASDDFKFRCIEFPPWNEDFILPTTQIN